MRKEEIVAVALKVKIALGQLTIAKSELEEAVRLLNELLKKEEE